jgi:hypothetical protein
VLIDIFREQKGNYCVYSDSRSIESGVLGELAGKELLQGIEDFLSDPENSPAEERIQEIDPLQLKITVEDATVEEDIFEQTDLRLHIEYDGLAFDLPVQIKCKQLYYAEEEDMDFMRYNLCHFGRPEPELTDTRKEYMSRILAQMDKFYDKHAEGIFMVIPRGCGGMEIGRDGFTNNELKLFAYPLIQKEICRFLQNHANNKRRVQDVQA